MPAPSGSAATTTRRPWAAGRSRFRCFRVGCFEAMNSECGIACRVPDSPRLRKHLLLDSLLPENREAAIAALKETKACSPTGNDHSHR